MTADRKRVAVVLAGIVAETLEGIAFVEAVPVPGKPHELPPGEWLWASVNLHARRCSNWYPSWGLADYARMWYNQRQICLHRS